MTLLLDASQFRISAGFPTRVVSIPDTQLDVSVTFKYPTGLRELMDAFLDQDGELLIRLPNRKPADAQGSLRPDISFQAAVRDDWFPDDEITQLGTWMWLIERSPQENEPDV